MPSWGILLAATFDLFDIWTMQSSAYISQINGFTWVFKTYIHIYIYIYIYLFIEYGSNVESVWKQYRATMDHKGTKEE